MIRILSSVLTLVILVGSPAFAKTQAEQRREKLNARIINFYQQQAADPFIGNFVLDREGLMVKTRLDAAVDRVLRAHPEVVLSVVGDVRQQMLGAITSESDKQMTDASMTSKHSTGHNETAYRTFIGILKDFGFPEDVIKNPEIHRMYVQSSNQVNAFTYVGLPLEYAHVVIFSALLEQLGPDALRAVLGHEVGHMRARHIYNSMMLTAIFAATGQDLLEDSQNAAKESAPKSTADAPAAGAEPDGTQMPSPKAALKEAQAMQSLMEEMSALVGQNLFSHRRADEGSRASLAQSRMSEAFPEIAKNLGQALRSKTTRAMRDEMVRNVMIAVDGDSSMLNVKPSMKQIIKFQQKLEALVHDQEATADRYGFLAAGRAGSEEADLVLTGGRSSNMDEARFQLEIRAHDLAQRPEIAALSGTGNHPDTEDRAAAYSRMERDPALQVMGDPVKKALADMVAAEQMIRNIDTRLTGNSGKIEEGSMLEINRAKLVIFVSDVRSLVLDTIDAEFKALAAKGTLRPGQVVTEELPVFARTLSFIQMAKAATANRPLFEAPALQLLTSGTVEKTDVLIGDLAGLLGNPEGFAAQLSARLRAQGASSAPAAEAPMIVQIAQIADASLREMIPIQEAKLDVLVAFNQKCGGPFRKAE